MTKLTIPIDPESIIIPKKPANKSASEHRKITKPIMEKKRRARMNLSLEQIRSILKENFDEFSKKNQLDKADVLEMTVKYLKLVTKDQFLKGILTSNNQQNQLNNQQNVQLIQTGFKDCKQKVNQCLAKLNPQINQRLNAHLIKFEQNQFQSMDCDQVLNLSINDHMVMNNSFNQNSFYLHTPNSASSTSSQSVFFPSAPSTPNSERSMSPIELTVHNRNRSVWRPW